MKNKLLLIIFLFTSAMFCVPEKCTTPSRTDDDNPAAENLVDHNEYQAALPLEPQQNTRVVQSYVEKLIARATPEEYLQSSAYMLIQFTAGTLCYPLDAAYNTAKNWWDMLNCLGPT